MEREPISLDSAIDLLSQRLVERATDIAQKIGQREFDRFLEAAKKSNIPEDFLNAASLITLQVKENSPSEEWREIAFRLVQKRFPMLEQAEYAIAWGGAISLVKKLTKHVESFTRTEARCQKLLAEHITHRSIPPRLLGSKELEQKREALLKESDELQEARENLSQLRKNHSALRRMVEGMCGSAIMIEEKVKGPKKLGRGKIRHLITTRLHRTASLQELEDVRLYLEEYFSKPKNCNRIVLLAQPRRI